MENIVGIHTSSFGPRIVPPQSWELLLQVASLIFYKENFGPVHLYCDQIAYDYYKTKGILELYDNVEMLDETLLGDIDQNKYFATSKILAQLQCDLKECIFMDMDIVVQSEHTKDWLDTETCSFLHKETPFVYDVDNEDSYAINCAFNLWKNKDLRRGYAAKALTAIRAGEDSMINAEQWTLSQFLINKNIEPKFYIKNIWDTEKGEFIKESILYPNSMEMIKNSFYHAWSEKRNFNTTPLKAADFTITLIELLETRPEFGLGKILEKLSV